MEGLLLLADGNQSWGVLRAGVLSLYENSECETIVRKIDILDRTKLYSVNSDVSKLT